MVGKHAKVKVKCGDHDGVTAVHCMLSKYGKCDVSDADNTEAIFEKAAHHFESGRQLNKANFLRPHLEDAICHPWYQAQGEPHTIIPIVAILSGRHYRYQRALEEFDDGGLDPDNCTLYLEDLFS